MKKQHINLAHSDRDYLKTLLSKSRLEIRKQKRAYALLELDKGKSYQDVSKRINISYVTISSWATKYKSGGLFFLDDKPRSGRPSELGDRELAKIAILVDSKPPEGHTRWSLRLLASRIVELGIVDSISFKQVGLLLKKMGYDLGKDV
ncbi:helix-turn-helix domain-containing protein [Aureispira anguillae]|uniref:Helix-turn-helix domain-containing protein n=1 Tax=Aureispira anguillae TaxID=2864201 RepID=A0A915YGU6_9BACT|nr:helix-turn-helix domain-containing protein [Aureispira anguillae]